jgi:DNA-binding NarL/FixJ family response regulator
MRTLKPRLLLADDSVDLLTEIAKLLDGQFSVLATAQDGVELVSIAQKLKFDAVVTDAEMPRLSGMEASREIISRKLCEAIVLLTVHNEWELVEAALAAGIKGYVLKIDAAEELVLAVHEVLAGRIFISRNASP